MNEHRKKAQLLNTQKWLKDKSPFPSLFAGGLVHVSTYVYYGIKAAEQIQLKTEHPSWSDEAWFGCYEKDAFTKWFDSIVISDLPKDEQNMISQVLESLHALFGRTVPEDFEEQLSSRRLGKIVENAMGLGIGPDTEESFIKHAFRLLTQAPAGTKTLLNAEYPIDCPDIKLKGNTWTQVAQSWLGGIDLESRLMFQIHTQFLFHLKVLWPCLLRHQLNVKGLFEQACEGKIEDLDILLRHDPLLRDHPAITRHFRKWQSKGSMKVLSRLHKAIEEGPQQEILFPHLQRYLTAAIHTAYTEAGQSPKISRQKIKDLWDSFSRDLTGHIDTSIQPDRWDSTEAFDMSVKRIQDRFKQNLID